MIAKVLYKKSPTPITSVGLYISCIATLSNREKMVAFYCLTSKATLLFKALPSFVALSAIGMVSP